MNAKALLWQCANCKRMNKPAHTECSCCNQPRLNGSWPKRTWLRERIAKLRKDAYDAL